MNLPAHRRSGHGPPVVLVHGTAPDLFDALEQQLQSTHTVVRYDRRGFPGSNLPMVTSLTPHAEDLAGLLATLDGPAVLVGWSIGGLIVLETALAHPARVAGLVLIEPPWLAKGSPTLAMLGGILCGKVLGALGRSERSGERFLSWALSRRDGPCELELLSPAERARVRAAGPAMMAELDGGTGEHLAGRLGPVRPPVRLLVGDRSTPEFEAAARRLAKVLGISPTTVPGAAHLMQHTHAAEVAAAVRGVVRG